MTDHFKIWIAVGLAGQFCFFARFLIQWLVSEKKKQSVIPISFWYLSLAGGIILLCYSIYRRDPVFTIGQSVGFIVYTRNLWLIQKNRKANPL
jgi:lipid-A-disaccharide synthase-like uncharacterized protein